MLLPISRIGNLDFQYQARNVAAHVKRALRHIRDFREGEVYSSSKDCSRTSVLDDALQHLLLVELGHAEAPVPVSDLLLGCWASGLRGSANSSCAAAP